MADEQSGTPLRRWRPFYGAFGAIDDAMEAAGHPRAEYRDVRVRILQMLRSAFDDDGKAEQLCATLDDVMLESLKSLLVAAPVPHSALASTELARAVGALGKHGSARIRTLAGDVVRGWGVAIDGDVATAKEKLDKLSGDRIPSKDILVTDGSARGCVVLALPATAEVYKKKLHVPPAKKMEAKKPPPVVAQSKKMEARKPIIAQSDKMENTKRKLLEGYQEAERLKHQRLIQKIDDKEAPKILVQSQRKMQRGPARCRTSSSVRRSLLPSLQLI